MRGHEIHKSQVIIILACEQSSSTGEGVLANKLIKTLIAQNKKIYIYNDFFYKSLSKIRFLKDRVLPFYLVFISLILRYQRLKVIYLNYCPIWNPFLFFISRWGVILGPITGSHGIQPQKGIVSKLIRKGLLNFLAIISKSLITSSCQFWAATPSVNKSLRETSCDLIYGRPTLSNLLIRNDIKTKSNKVKIFCYSSNHPIKNNSEFERLIAMISHPNLEITIVSKSMKPSAGLRIFQSLNKEDFNMELRNSTHYLTLSYEDAGITFFEAVANGLELIFPIESPKIKTYTSSINFSLKDLTTAAQRIKMLADDYIKNIKIINSNFEALEKEKENSQESLRRWISWI